MFYKNQYLSIVTIYCILTGSVLADPANLAERFKLIGEYKTRSKTKFENGIPLKLIISPLIYQVYSDGIDVRIYNKEGGDDSYTVYHIYSSEGIGVVSQLGEIDYMAGIQARSLDGNMIRQISLTRDNLVMVKIPSRSSRVLITDAQVITEITANTLEAQP